MINFSKKSMKKFKNIWMIYTRKFSKENKEKT